MSRAAWIAVGAVAVGSLAVGLVACYNPNPADGSFTCDADNGFMCPEGLACDRQAGLCVKKVSPDLGGGNALPNFDLSGPEAPRSCGQRVVAGAFSNLVNMGAVNNAGDQSSIALSGNQIFWIEGTAFMSATLSSNKKTASSPTPVALAGAPAVIYGGSFAKDGSYWFTASSTLNGASNLFKATGTLPALTAVLQTQPATSACSFFDPTFSEGDPAGELYLAYSIAGCNMPQGKGPTVVQGVLGKQIGTFYAAFAGFNFRSPFLLPGSTTMLFGSVGTDARLYYSVRAANGTDAAWTAPQLLPMGSIGTGTRDVQAMVSADCSVLYLVSQRNGTAGLDLWAADIAAQ